LKSQGQALSPFKSVRPFEHDQIVLLGIAHTVGFTLRDNSRLIGKLRLSFARDKELSIVVMEEQLFGSTVNEDKPITLVWPGVKELYLTRFHRFLLFTHSLFTHPSSVPSCLPKIDKQLAT